MAPSPNRDLNPQLLNDIQEHYKAVKEELQDILDRVGGKSMQVLCNSAVVAGRVRVTRCEPKSYTSVHVNRKVSRDSHAGGFVVSGFGFNSRGIMRMGLLVRPCCYDIAAGILSAPCMFANCPNVGGV